MALSIAADPWQAWTTLLERTPETGFMQAPWWAEFRGAVGYRHFGITLKHGGAMVGGAVVHRLAFDDERCFYYIPEGPVLPSDPDLAEGVFAAILDEVEARRRWDELRVSHLRIEPRWASLPPFVTGFTPLAPFSDRYIEPRNTLCIDLRLPEGEILAQMKPKGRYNIRLAQRHGVRVVEDTSAAGLADFIGLHDRMAERQRIRGKPDDYFEGLLQVFTVLRNGALFFAEYGGERIATALVIYFGKRATYFFGASLDHHREVMAPYLLHWEVMRAARRLGCEWYDLWGIAPAGTGDHPWRDITVFKRKFGGVELNLVPTLDRVYDRDAYERFRAL